MIIPDTDKNEIYFGVTIKIGFGEYEISAIELSLMGNMVSKSKQKT